MSTHINWVNALGSGPTVWFWRLFATTPKRRKFCFSQDEGISPKLQEVVQHVHAHQLGECAWQWIRCLMMASLRNQTECKLCLFGREGISPKLHQALHPFHAQLLAQVVWPWTRRLVTAPLCNHIKAKENCFFH
jgi:hypothetical protein